MPIARLPQSRVLHAMTRYMLVGSSSTVVDWGLFALFLYVLDWHYMLAGAVSFVLATLLNYLLSVAWVFEAGRHSRHKEVALIYMASGIGLLINLSVLYALVEWFALHVFLAKVLASTSAFLWNFSARYFWIFHGASQPAADSA